MSNVKSIVTSIQNKAQLFLIVVFLISVSSMLLFVLLSPFIQQVKNIITSLDSYQAIASAETGMEIELLNQFHNSDLLKGSGATRSISDGGKCESDTSSSGSGSPQKRDRYSKTCTFPGNQGQDISDITFDLFIKQQPLVFHIDSIGKKQFIERTLFLEEQ